MFLMYDFFFFLFRNFLCYNIFITERYKVDEVLQDSREDCYLATLRIVDTDVHDSRPYYLVVENERGIDRHAISLVVEGMFTGALLILLFILHNITLLFYDFNCSVQYSRSSVCLFGLLCFIFHFIHKIIK